MTHCHGTSKAHPLVSSAKRVAVLGMPNVGKSTLFNQLTGSRAFVGNWPGITVDLLEANVTLNDQELVFVDLPGIYDLEGYSEDEQVVQDFLSRFDVDLVLIVLNASQIERQIRLPLQIKTLGLPAVLILNMADEAKHFGIQIDTEQLAIQLDMPVTLVSAKYNRGLWEAKRQISAAIAEPVAKLSAEKLKTQLTAHESVPAAAIEVALEGAVQFPSERFRTLTEQLDAILLHPVFGLPIFFLTIFLMFEFVWQVGLPSQDLADQVTDWVRGIAIEPLTSYLPSFWQGLLVDGLYGGLAVVASFVPLILLFFFMMAIVEDSGYFSRAAYMMDALMYRLGLDGRSFVLLMMGFGCNIPGIMGTRVMRSQSLRLLTTLILPFALCSARLTVFVFIIDALFDRIWGPIVLMSLYLFSFLVAFATAFVMKGQFDSQEPFVIELPPYRLPTLQQVMWRGWSELREFLNRATGFITIGVVSVWLLSNLPAAATLAFSQGQPTEYVLCIGLPWVTASLVHHGMDNQVGPRLQRFIWPVAIAAGVLLGLTFWPGIGTESYAIRLGNVFTSILQPTGIPEQLTIALIFGFIAKEIVVGSLASVYHLANTDAVQAVITQTVTPAQGYSFMLFCLLYTPCISTLATIHSETKNRRFTLFTLGYGLVLAWIASTLFYQSARILGLA